MWHTEIIGHEKISRYLFGMSVDQFPHALLMTGMSGIGKTTLALHAASRLLGCAPEQAETHPRIIRLTAGADPKTGAPRAAIPVAAVRELRIAFHMTHREPLVILIERAEELQQESGNALLKIMEEPTQQLYFMILAQSDDSVLQTIRSRCATVRLSAVPTHTLAAALEKIAADRGAIPQALEIAEGRPGVAIRYLTDATFHERVVSERMRFGELRAARTLAHAEKIITDLFAKKDRHIEARQELVEMLGWWLTWLRRDTPHHPAIAQIAHTIPLLLENMHPRLLMERVVIELIA